MNTGKAARDERQRDLTEGPPLQKIIVFAVPLLIGNVFQQLYNIIDSIVVGNFVGTDALAAVGVCAPIIFTVMSLFMGISAAVSVLASHRKGAGDREGLQRVMDSANRYIVLGFLPVTVLGVFFSGSFLRLINVSGSVLGEAEGYLRIYFLGALAVFGSGINTGLLRGLGDGVAALRFLAVSCLMNIALDVLFVAGFGWGVPGAAWATVIAEYVPWLFSHRYLKSRYNPKGPPFLKSRLTPSVGREILELGVPTAVQHAAFNFGVLLIQALINRQDTAFLAGFNAAGRIDLFAFMPIQSFATALTAFTGQNHGAGKPERIEEGIRETGKALLLLDTVLIGLVLLLGKWMLRAFSRDEAVLEAGWAYLVRILPFYTVLTVSSLLAAILRGTGVVLMPTLITMAALWLGRVPAAYIMERCFGRNNIFFCYGIGWLVELALLRAYYGSGKWKKQTIFKDKGNIL